MGSGLVSSFLRSWPMSKVDYFFTGLELEEKGRSESDFLGVLFWSKNSGSPISFLRYLEQKIKYVFNFLRVK